MFPILFRVPLPSWHLPWLGQLGELPIYSYGIMLGISLIVGWFVSLGLARRDGMPEEELANCYIVSCLLALLGSRVLYVVTNLSEFPTWRDMLSVQNGGYVAYGGFLGGFLGSFLYLRRKQIPILPWGDATAPGLAAGLMITRIGCYLYGCDFGKQLSSGAPALLRKLGTFPHWPEKLVTAGSGSPAWVEQYQRNKVALDSTTALPVHPTQLYESLVGLGLLLLLLWQRKHQKFRGQLFLLLVFAYGVSRYLIEILRDDDNRGAYGPAFSEDVILPGGLLVLALAYILWIAKVIPGKSLRLATQVLALVPPLALYLVLKPGSFEQSPPVMLSTSQWVAVLSGAVAAVFYGMYFDAALAHPASAMAIDLAGFYELTGKPPESATTEAPPSRAPSKPSRKGATKSSAEPREDTRELTSSTEKATNPGASQDKPPEEPDATDKPSTMEAPSLPKSARVQSAAQAPEPSVDNASSTATKKEPEPA